MQAGPLSCFCNLITAARMCKIAFKKADYLERIRKRGIPLDIYPIRV